MLRIVFCGIFRNVKNVLAEKFRKNFQSFGKNQARNLGKFTTKKIQKIQTFTHFPETHYQLQFKPFSTYFPAS
jgi:hypothetical protein